MPLILPDQLIDKDVLNRERIFTMTREEASHQDIRPIKIAIVNLMPKKEETELQLLRMLSNSALQMDIDLVRMGSHRASHSSQDRLEKFYKTYDDIKGQKFDAMIITGAPVEKLQYREIVYWKELQKIFDFAREHVYSTMFICWSAQAALNYYYHVPNRLVEEKIFGVFQYEKRGRDPILKGFDDEFFMPQSRYTYVAEEDIRDIDQLQVLAAREDTGISLATSLDHRFIFSFGHWEYDKETLHEEYLRDLERGLKTKPAKNYYKNNDPRGDIRMNWRSSGSLFFSNWLNYCVYQATPYQLESIKGINVSKFGGSSLASGRQFAKVKKIVRDKEDRQVLVVSAPGKRDREDEKVTDLLDRFHDLKLRDRELDRLLETFSREKRVKEEARKQTLARVEDRFLEIIRDLQLENLEKEVKETLEDLEKSKSRDFDLSRGEYLNAKILAAYLGYDFIDAKDLIYMKEGDRLDYRKTSRAIEEKISKGKKVVVPGFYGLGPDGEIVTFKRGGSDYTGSIIASSLQSEVYENWTDVSGIRTGDPKKLKETRKIPYMDYRELADLVDKGAQVYQKEAIDPVREKNIPLKILNTNDPEDEGTLIRNREEDRDS